MVGVVVWRESRTCGWMRWVGSVAVMFGVTYYVARYCVTTYSREVVHVCSVELSVCIRYVRMGDVPAGRPSR